MLPTAATAHTMLLPDLCQASIAHTTGSTDNTAELIQETMKDMPGELFHDKFEDFSTSRNLVGGAGRTAATAYHAAAARLRAHDWVDHHN
jgi:hypothetical protein